MNFPRDEKGRIQVPRKMYEDPRYRIDFIVHQENFSRFDNYSFPDPYIVWEEGNSTLLLEKNLTKEHIIYIHTDGMHIGPIYRSKCFFVSHTGAKTNFLSRNYSTKNLMFKKSEFCDKWDFENVNFVKNDIF